LETFERIKHIFYIKNVKFILVYNEEVLKSIISKKYGSNIDAKRYLHKFVQKTFYLDRDYKWCGYHEWFVNEIYNENEKFANQEFLAFLKENGYLIINAIEPFNLTLRDIQHVLRKLKQYLFLMNDDEKTFAVCVEFLKYINKTEYDNMIAYYNKHGKFVSDIPIRDTFNKIYNDMTETKNVNEIADEVFCKYCNTYSSWLFKEPIVGPRQ